MKPIDINEFKKREKYIKCSKHPTEDLYLWSYNKTCQHEWYWDAFTREARGLITDLEGNIIARPFPKFFELNQHEESMLENLPNTDYDIYEKVDGCFTHNTKVNLWAGGTMKIGDIVNKKLTPTLIGMDKSGKLVPTKVLDWFDNGTKNKWLDLTLDCPVSKKSGGGNHPNKLRVTPNHKLCINNKWDYSVTIKPGDTLTTYEDTPDEVALHYIKSMLLGDGCLVRINNAVRFTNTCKEAHFTFLQVRHTLLGDVAQGYRSRLSGYGSSMKDLASKTLKSLIPLREEWYPRGKKCVPEDITWIDDLSIAIWYMEDGSRAKSDKQADRALFATNGFTKKDCLRLKDKLEELYNINAIVFNSKGWNIRINKGKDNSIETFWRSIRKYIAPCMQYKLPIKHQGYFDITDIPRGVLNKKPKQCRVLDVTTPVINKKNFPHGRKGFDIKTETSNYFCKGVLVHNSLGILYFIEDIPYITTKGSFVSEQAIRASKAIQDTGLTKKDFNEGTTYLFEIVYPKNRVVVDYGNRDELVLLAVLDTETGEAYDFIKEAKRLNFTHAKVFNEKIQHIVKTEFLDSLSANEEGFVVLYNNGLRVKVKGSEYKRLHRLCGAADGKKAILYHIEQIYLGSLDYEEFISSLPDHVKGIVIEEFTKALKSIAIYETTYEDALHASLERSTRKEQALFLMENYKTISGLVFAALNGKNITKEVIFKFFKKHYLKGITNE